MRVANALKIYGGEMVKQESARLLRKNKEIYCPLEVIEGGTGISQKLSSQFLALPDELSKTTSEELASAYRESMGLVVSIMLQVSFCLKYRRCCS